MEPPELYEALHALISERVPLHIYSPRTASANSLTSGRSNSIPSICAATAHLSRSRGVVAPKFLPVDGEGILFLDEPTAAPQITRAGCYQLVLDRKPGEYRLPDGWGVSVNRHDSFGGAIISTSVWTKAKPLAQGAKLL